MLGLMMKSPHAGKALAFFLVLAAIGLGLGLANGSFEHNNRQSLREAREAATLQAN